MIRIELQLITVLRALVEIAGMFLLAQGALFLLAGGGRQRNIVYQLLRIVTRPVIAATRRSMPQAIADRYLPAIAFIALFCLWIALAYLRQRVCASNSCG